MNMANSSPPRSHTPPKSSLYINSHNVIPHSNVTCVSRFFMTGAMTNAYPTLKIYWTGNLVNHI